MTKMTMMTMMERLLREGVKDMDASERLAWKKEVQALIDVIDWLRACVPGNANAQL